MQRRNLVSPPWTGRDRSQALDQQLAESIQAWIDTGGAFLEAKVGKVAPQLRPPRQDDRH